MNENKKKLLSNTFFLYWLTFINQFLNIITIPYQTRVLGAELYGSVSVVLAIMVYIQLFLDFGFILSATQEVTKANNDYRKICKIYTTVFIIKIVISIILFFTIMFLMKLICINSQDIILLFILYYIAYIINSLLPDFVFRGLEDMRVITIRTVIVKCIFASALFMLVRKPEDFLKMPVLQILANAISVIMSMLYMKKKYRIHFVKIELKYLLDLIKKTFPFFCSRISSTFYQALNMIIIGYKYTGMAEVGFYASSEKIISVSKSVASPLADSIYPYMIKTKDYALIKKILKITIPILLVCAVIGIIFAEEIVVILFGNEYFESATILRIMIPIAVVVLPTYLLAFPIMVPMGLEKYANLSNVFGAFLQIIGLVFLFLYDLINIYSVAILSTCVEVLVFAFRLFFVLKKRNKFLS